MKKTFRSVISLLLLLGILGSTLLAAQAEGISPRYTGISSLVSSLSISAGGGATCRGHVTLRDGYTADLKVELKQDDSTIRTWTNSGKGTFSAGATYYVASGHKYVVTTTATVYDSDGNVIEIEYEDSVVSSY